MKKIKSDLTERNRFLILSITILFLFDYLLFCFISGKNPLNIIPSLPVLEDKTRVDIYLPDKDGKTILKEPRKLTIPEDREGYARLLVKEVISGSNIENTSIVVPVDIFIRKMWFYEDICIIDVIPSLLEINSRTIPDSETTFRESLKKTIIENIPAVKKVVLLERGIPERHLW